MLMYEIDREANRLDTISSNEKYFFSSEQLSDFKNICTLRTTFFFNFLTTCDVGRTDYDN
ncbi:unnamed protein product, partial [Callosobruchus maculatus]